MCLPLLAGIPAAIGSALGTTATAGGLVLAGTALAGASSALQFFGQQQAASAQEDAWRQTAELTNADLRLKYQQMQLRELEERQAFAQQSMEIGRRTARALGYTQAAAGEGGVYGNTVNMLMQDFGRQQSESFFAMQRSAQMRSQQFGLESLGYQQAGVANINRSAPTTSQPFFLSPILQTAGAGLGYAAAFMGPGRNNNTSPANTGEVPYYLARPQPNEVPYYLARPAGPSNVPYYLAAP